MATESARTRAKLWVVRGSRPADGGAPSSEPLGPDSPPSWSGSGTAAPVAPPPALDDSELLAALRRGDVCAAASLHDRVRPQVDRTIRRLLGPNDNDCEDIAQLVMIELVSTIGRYRGDCSLDSWTTTIAAHVVYKHIRRRKTERRLFGALDPDVLAEARSSSRPGRDVVLRDVVRCVRAHLEAMDETKAWTFLLHDVCGHDLREIAEITGVTVAAAQTRLVRGRRELHERIAGDPGLAHLLDSSEGEL
jgi:RNA polymerase sigma-70 factor, ECF subfamily